VGITFPGKGSDTITLFGPSTRLGQIFGGTGESLREKRRAVIQQRGCRRLPNLQTFIIAEEESLVVAVEGQANWSAYGR
jgi:hypothetical protein